MLLHIDGKKSRLQVENTYNEWINHFPLGAINMYRSVMVMVVTVAMAMLVPISFVC